MSSIRFKLAGPPCEFQLLFIHYQMIEDFIYSGTTILVMIYRLCLAFNWRDVAFLGRIPYLVQLVGVLPCYCYDTFYYCEYVSGEMHSVAAFLHNRSSCCISVWIDVACVACGVQSVYFMYINTAALLWLFCLSVFRHCDENNGSWKLHTIKWNVSFARTSDEYS